MIKKLLAAVLLLGLLTGCSLARPEDPEAQSPDRLVGVYVMPGDRSHPIQEDENWIEYGSWQADTDFGKLDFPRMVLPAVYDPENRELFFPSAPGGCALYAIQVEDARGVSNIIGSDCFADGASHVISTDFGDSFELSGTLMVAENESTIWTVYHLYQTPEGMVYLDSSGNSYQGSGFSTTLTEEHKVQVQDEEGSVYTKLTVAVRAIPPLTGLVLRQYDADGALLASADLPLAASIPDQEWLPQAAWALVEEHSAEGVSRTLCPREGSEPDVPAHTVWLLGENGIGQAVPIYLR